MKKKNVRKPLALLLAAALAASLAGCGQGQTASSALPSSQNSGSSQPEPESASQPEETEESLYPVVTDGSITLKYWCSIANQATQFIQNYSENLAYQEIMKNTGINIEFIHPASGQEKEQFNIMMVSGSLPDIVGGAQQYSGGVSQGVEDGFFVDLAPYLEECAPDYYELINSSEEAHRQTYHGERVCAFYPLTFEAAPPWLRPLVRQDLLDEFGMEALATYDDYETYFQNILDKKDGITPFVFRADNSNDMNVFMSGYDMLFGFYVKDGKIQHYYSDENLLPFLTMMNDWYQKGYISKDSAALDSKQIFAMYDAGQLGCYIDSVDTLYSRDSESEVLTIGSAPYPRKTEDQQIHTAPSTDIRGASYHTAITTNCQNIEAAVKFLNYGYTEEGSRIYNYGVEGQTFTIEDGEPKFTDMMLKPENGMTASNVSFIYKIHFGPKLCEPDTKAHPGVVGDEDALAFRFLWADDPNVDSSYRCPPFTLNEEETSERATIMTNLDTYAQEMILRFITGVDSLSNFDAFSAQIEELGMSRAIELTQQAYDRYMAGE